MSSRDIRREWREANRPALDRLNNMIRKDEPFAEGGPLAPDGWNVVPMIATDRIREIDLRESEDDE